MRDIPFTESRADACTEGLTATEGPTAKVCARTAKGRYKAASTEVPSEGNLRVNSLANGGPHISSLATGSTSGQGGETLLYGYRYSAVRTVQ